MTWKGGEGLIALIKSSVFFFEEEILMSVTRLKSNLDDVTFLHLIFEIRHDY